MKRILIFLTLVPVLSVITCVTAAGQGATAQISGTVKGPKRCGFAWCGNHGNPNGDRCGPHGVER